MRIPSLTIALVLFPTILGCASFKPRPRTNAAFLERAETQRKGNVRVTIAIPSAKESRDIFGVPLARSGIQAVWLRVENNETVPYIFLPLWLDHDYYSPAEAAYKNRRAFSPSANRLMEAFFGVMAMPDLVVPGETISGFVFVNPDEGIKEVRVALLGPQRIKRLDFFVPVAGIKTDYEKVDFDALYPAEKIVSLNEEGLRTALECFPSCTMNKRGTRNGDPLNIVLIGREETIFASFIRSGWDETERTYLGSAWKTLDAFLHGKKYRYSPISPLYVFGRPQDIALQKARETIHERNHLRLWLTPLRFGEKSVWVGQISRDIGIRFTLKAWPGTTHKIDPDVDETRGYLIQDLLKAEGLEELGFVGGVGAASMDKPRGNLTGDPYFTDGLRAVMVISDTPTPYSDVRFFNWEILLIDEQDRLKLLRKIFRREDSF